MESAGSTFLSTVFPREKLKSLDLFHMLRRPLNQELAVYKEKNKVCSVVKAVNMYASFYLSLDFLILEFEH